MERDIHTELVNARVARAKLRPRGKNVGQRLRVQGAQDPLDIAEFAAKLEAPALRLALYRCFDEIKALRAGRFIVRRVERRGTGD